MAEHPFDGKTPRHDLNESFPASMVETKGPALLGDREPLSAALVAAYVLRAAAGRGGTRVKPSSTDDAIATFERALGDDARRWCEDEAERVARWCVEPPSEEVEELEGDLAVMASADQESRLLVVSWAIDEGFDLEIEWYDDEEERWPRMRVTPVDVSEVDGESEIIVQTTLARISIPVANVRWVMPVQRREEPRPKLARVLAFPFGSDPTQEE